MSNEAIYVYEDQVTLEASGASAASNAFVAADDANFTSANHANYPMADFVLTADFAAAVAIGGAYVALYRQDLNIDGTSDSIVPSATNKQKLVGLFSIPSTQSASAVYPCNGVPLTQDCQFSLENVTGQTMSAAWTLKATPKTLGPAA